MPTGPPKQKPDPFCGSWQTRLPFGPDHSVKLARTPSLAFVTKSGSTLRYDSNARDSTGV
jgi:hypothetical protein